MVSHNLILGFNTESMYEQAKIFYANDSYYTCKGYNDTTLSILFEDEDNEPDLLQIQIECELNETLLADYYFMIC